MGIGSYKSDDNFGIEAVSFNLISDMKVFERLYLHVQKNVNL